MATRLVTENEFLSAAVDDEDGHLKFTRDSGETVDAGKVRVDVTPEVAEARDEAVAARDAAVAARDAAEAVPTTNDTVMASVAADEGSAFSTQLSATISHVAGGNFGWVTARDAGAFPEMDVPPTVSWVPPSSGQSPYSDNLAHDTDLVRHPGGIYAEITKGGILVLDNQVNLPSPNPIEGVAEFIASGTVVAPRYYASTLNGLTFRVFVDGQLAYTGVPEAAGQWFMEMTFPFAAARRIRIESLNAMFAGIGYESSSMAISPVVDRRPVAALYGDSWVGGSGLSYYQLMYYFMQNGLGWEMCRMGHGGSGYVGDAAGASAPMTDPTRLASLASQGLDYVIIQGSVNDDTQTDASVVGDAAASVYTYLAEESPKTRIIVIGPQPDATLTVPAQRAANRDAIRQAALSAPNVVKWLDPLDGEWVTDASDFADSAHLTEAGNLKWATRFITELVRP